MKKRQTIVQPQVYIEAEKIYEYIKLNSPQNSEKFKHELINQINKVEANPEAFPPEKFLNTKRIQYRFALVMASWKLIFKVTRELLIFLGLVHTSRHPKEIQNLGKAKDNV